MRKLLFFIISICIFSSFILFFNSPVSADKSYYFPNVSIDISINKDRSINVVEKRAFSFSGSFTRVFWDIPLEKDQEITDISISDDYSDILYNRLPVIDENRPQGNFATGRQGNEYHIEAYHDSYNTIKTFTLSYRLSNVLKKYQDVGELYWKAIGDKWDAKTDKVIIRIHMPLALSSSQRIYIWGHGPLNGVAGIIDGITPEFTVTDLRQNQFVEVRVLFPTDLLQGVSSSENVLERIKKEEQGFQTKIKLIQQGKFIIFIFIIISIVIWIIYWFRLFLRHGKEYKITSVPKYLQMPPGKLKPALVEALISQNQTVTPNSFSATILDLARQKKIEVRASGKYSRGLLGIGSGMKYLYSLHLQDSGFESDLNLEDFEKDVIRFVFQNTETVDLETLKKRMKNSPSVTSKFFQAWTGKVKKVAESKNFLEPESKKYVTKFIISNILFWLLIFTCLIVVFGLSDRAFPILGVLMALITIYTLILSYTFKRWTKDAGIEAAKWQSFKRYINNLSEIRNSLPQAAIIWQEILIYGTALGVSKKIAEYLPLILSQQGANISPSWYHVYSSGGSSIDSSVSGIGTSIGTDFASSFSSMVSSFNSSFSSNSGSGGGFSGGGGGGGGRG